MTRVVVTGRSMNSFDRFMGLFYFSRGSLRAWRLLLFGGWP
jgi:hypothetical protein